MKTYRIFDLETRIDKSLINRARYPGLHLSDAEAYARYRAELQAERGSDFIPILYHIPITIAVGQVTSDYRLLEVVTLGYDPDDDAVLTHQFWSLVKEGHTLVTFNGRGFDLPVMELAALKYGIAAPAYWVAGTKGPRYRYSEEWHLDVADVLCNAGAVPRLRLGDLLIALGFTGKGDIDGSKVQGLWEAGKLAEIGAYCRKDVIMTYILFMRLELIRGRVTNSIYENAIQHALTLIDKV